MNLSVQVRTTQVLDILSMQRASEVGNEASKNHKTERK